MSRAILGYEDVKNDLQLEIFGIEFDVSLTQEYIKDLKSMDIDKMKQDNAEEGSDDFILIRKTLDKILGEGAYNKISEKYKTDKKEEMGLDTIVKIYTFIFQQYEKVYREISNPNFTKYSNPNNNENRNKNYRNNYNPNYNKNRNSNYNRY